MDATSNKIISVCMETKVKRISKTLPIIFLCSDGYYVVHHWTTNYIPVQLYWVVWNSSVAKFLYSLYYNFEYINKFLAV